MKYPYAADTATGVVLHRLDRPREALTSSGSASRKRVGTPVPLNDASDL